ncbi:hypothetical protein [Brevundimonas sp.]|nr:hypothetical protein [Brevundimonas sp.]
MTTTRTRATTIRMAIVMGMDTTTAIRTESVGTIMDRWTRATGVTPSA